MVKRLAVVLALVALIAVQLFATLGSVFAAGEEYFTATLNGPSEVPSNATTGTGSVTLIIDSTGSFIYYDVTYSGLTGPATAAHIHLGAVGVAGGIMLPLTVGPSPMVGFLSAADLKPTGTVMTFADALNAIRAGNAYVNVHTAAHPSGEIRGQLGLPAVSPKFVLGADQPMAVPKGHNWAFDDFFPRTATIAAGDTFLFVNQGFHTFTLLPMATTAAADSAASSVTADADDTKLNANGTKHSSFAIPALFPVTPTPGCGSISNPCTFDGSSILSSGISLSGPPEPFFVKVTAAAGAYTFHCRIHVRMTGSLTVVPAGNAGTTTAASADAAVATQVASAVAAGLAVETANSKATSHRNASGTTTWTVRLGAATPDGRVSLLEILPRGLKVRRGDTVVWRPTDSNEIHTVTFPTELHSDTLPLCEAGAVDTPAVPTVNPPTSPADFACSGHPPDELEFGGGNGVRVLASPKTVSDSGIVAYRSVPMAFGLLPGSMLTSWSVRISSGAVRGTYHYLCQVHFGMVATLTVH